MRISYIISMAVLLLVTAVCVAQSKGVVVDYNNPQKYVIGGVTVEGNNHFSQEQILQVTGLRKGMEVTVPSETFSSIVNRLWLQKFFEDVAVSVDSIAPSRDTAFFKVSIIERPRVSRWTFSGVKSGEQKELMDRLNLRRGGEFSDYVAKTATGIIKRYYKEKGFHNVDVQVNTKRDSVIRSAIRVQFAVDRGQKVKIKTITFKGADHVKESKLVRSMKKTRDARFRNFFSSKKFNEAEYSNDKRSLISAFNEAGYRDARIVKDSMYYIEPGKLQIDFEIDEGKQYFFRDITWVGNTKYSSEELSKRLRINKGDPYNKELLDRNLQYDPTGTDIYSLYTDDGYLFFRVIPIEIKVENDSIDIEMRVYEGKQARIGKVSLSGNTVTNDYVVMRELKTYPGELFSRDNVYRSAHGICAKKCRTSATHHFNSVYHVGRNLFQTINSRQGTDDRATVNQHLRIGSVKSVDAHLCKTAVLARIFDTHTRLERQALGNGRRSNTL